MLSFLLKKTFCFGVGCTVLPLMMMACLTPDTRLEDAQNTIAEPMIEFLTEEFKKKCPKGLNSYIKAKIYIYAHPHRGGPMSSVEDQKKAFLDGIDTRYEISCDEFLKAIHKPESN